MFCRSDADDVETAQSTHQLTEDKKEVALEAELEAKGTPAFIGLCLFFKQLPHRWHLLLFDVGSYDLCFSTF